MRGKKIPNQMIPVLYALVAIALVWMFWYYGSDIFYKLNKQKFPPKIPYIIWSLFSLVTLFVFYNRLKISRPNFLTNVGQSAIFYYFAQGMSSSLIYFIVVPLKDAMSWWLLVLIIYPINILLAFLIATGLQKVDNLGWKILQFLREKTASKN
jgi:hypothetical protein